MSMKTKILGLALIAIVVLLLALQLFPRRRECSGTIIGIVADFDGEYCRFYLYGMVYAGHETDKVEVRVDGENIELDATLFTYKKKIAGGTGGVKFGLWTSKVLLSSGKFNLIYNQHKVGGFIEDRKLELQAGEPVVIVYNRMEDMYQRAKAEDKTLDLKKWVDTLVERKH